MSEHNSGIEIVFWGVRGSIATPGPHTQRYGGNTSCIQITLPEHEHLLVFDCGSGSVNLGNLLVKKQKPLSGRMFFTHCHWDHVQAIPFFKPFYAAGNSFDIHMHPQDGNSCEEIVNMIMSPAFFPVSSDAFHADISFHDEKFRKTNYPEGYSIESLQTRHPGTTVMYKVSVGGKTIVYCPDNEYMMASDRHKKQMQEFIHQADVLIHDSQETRESYKLRHGWGHTSWEDTVELASSQDVRNLFLTHHDPESDDETLDKRTEQLQAHVSKFEHVQFAIEGERFRID